MELAKTVHENQQSLFSDFDKTKPPALIFYGGTMIEENYVGGFKWVEKKTGHLGCN